MKKLKLFFAALALLVGGANSASATDYLTDFSKYTVTKTAVSNDATSGTAREFWRGGVINFDISGTSTEVPSGVYSFSMQGMYRGHLTKDIPTGIIAYAESDGVQYMAPICNKTDGTVETLSPAGFNTAFNNDANNYLNKIPYIIVTDGKIKVGVKSMSTQPFCDNGMWFVFNTASFKVSDVTDNDVLSTALSDIKAQAAGLLASNSDESTARSNLQSAYDAATATASDIVNVKQKIDAYLTYLIENATDVNPKDISYCFTNPKYSIRNLDLVGGLVTSGKTGALGQPFGWTCFDAGGKKDNGCGNAFQENQGFNWFSTIGNTTELDGQAANYDVEKSGGYSIYQRISWNQWAEQTHSAKQTVTLPAGKYKISVPAYASAKDDDYKGYVIFNINGTEYNNEVTAGSWNVYEKEFTLTASAEVSVDMQFNKLRYDKNVGKQYAYFDGVTLTVSKSPVQVKSEELAALQATITDEAYFNNAAYTNVVGTERTDLTAAKSTTAASETFEAYETAIASVQAAIDAFVAAKTNYDLLATEVTKATALGVDASGYAATSSSTAASALTNTQNLKVAEYTYVTTNYAYGVSLGEWTTEGYTSDNNGQHWDGSDGSKYKEQENSWSEPKKGYAADSWSIKFYQSIELPAGNYVFKVAGRKAAGSHTTMSLDVTKTSDDSSLGSINDFPEGDTGLGINKSGATSFNSEDAAGFANGGAGRGWEWRYVKFTLPATTEVKIGVNADADASSQWMSFCNYTLQTDNEANISLIAYNIALNDAITARDNASYANVTGSEKTDLLAAIAADASLDKSDKAAIDAAKTNLETKTAAFTGAKSSYDAYVAAKAVVYPTLAYATTAKRTTLDDAQAAADATSASDATTKTNAIYTASRKYYESHALGEGVSAEPIAISESRFAGLDADDIKKDDWKIGTAWNLEGQNNGNISFETANSLTDGDGNADYQYIRIQKNDNNAGIKQTINLASGRYLMTVATRCRSGKEAKFEAHAGSVWVDCPQSGDTGGIYGNGWNDTSVEFIVKEAGDIEFGVKSNWGKDIWWNATRFRLVRLGDAFVSATIGDTGWTTFASSNALNLSDITASTGDAAAYYASAVNGETVTVTSTNQAAVKAGEGIMLKGTAGATISIPIVLSGSAITGNMLVGCTSNTTITNATEGYSNIYVLGIKSGTTDVAEFQNVKNYIDKSNTVDIPAGKAYLKSTDASGRSLTIVDADEIITGVDAVEAASKAIVKEGKFIENGKLVIFMKGIKFNANGQVIK